MTLGILCQIPSMTAECMLLLHQWREDDVTHTQSLTYQHVWAQHQRVERWCRDDEFVRILLPHDSLPCLFIIIIIMVVSRWEGWVGWRCGHGPSMTQCCRKNNSLSLALLCLQKILTATVNIVTSTLPIFSNKRAIILSYIMFISCLTFPLFHS